MTWEETIIKIREVPEFKDLVRLAYFDVDLDLNIKRFGSSEEFTETLKIISKYLPDATTILDIGSGNGISAVNFALKGFEVTAVEPDRSDTVGSGAIEKLRSHFSLTNLKVFSEYAEDINFPNDSFDIVYMRQAMHHANDLEKFLNEGVRVLKPKGLLLTIRDHVIFNDRDKKLFLDSHPLHKYYGGENAYKAEEYKNAIIKAGAIIEKEIKHYDSVINYFPENRSDLDKIVKSYNSNLRSHLNKKIGFISKFPFVFYLYKLFKGFSISNILDETKIPGRMYSYIAFKK